MALSNQALLTKGDRAYAKKKSQNRVESVTFDRDSREDYLTGFHKRKVKRQQDAKKRAEEIARKEKIAERQRIRQEKQKSIEKDLERLKDAERVINGIHDDSENESGNDANQEDEEDGEFKGFSDNSGILKHKTVYSDGQNETSVTVEEITLDPYVDMSRAEDILKESTKRAHAYAKHVEELENGPIQKPKPKPRKKKFRYLPKSERKLMSKKAKSSR